MNLQPASLKTFTCSHLQYAVYALGDCGIRAVRWIVQLSSPAGLELQVLMGVSRAEVSIRVHVLFYNTLYTLAPIGTWGQSI